MTNVLLLGAGTQGLAIIRCLHKSGHKVWLISERNNYADWSRYLEKAYYTNSLPSSKEFMHLVLQVVERHRIDVLIPMGDVLSEFISNNLALLKGKVACKMPDPVVFDTATDKNKLMTLCKKNGYPHPLTINSDEIKSTDKRSFLFPLLIKPNITCGARGMTLVHNYEELTAKLPEIQAEYGECHLQQYVKQGGAQVEVQLYVDENGKLLNSSVIYKYRWYPEKGGSSCCAKSVRNDKIVSILHQLLIDLGWVGFADFDTIEDPDTGELLIMELNPRVPACVKTAIEAGINWGEIIVNGYLDKPQKQYEYKENEFLRHLGFETLWFLKSPNKFKTYPSWFRFFGKHIHYQDMSDWTDPLPFIVGSLHNIKKVLTHSEKTKINR